MLRSLELLCHVTLVNKSLRINMMILEWIKKAIHSKIQYEI